MSFIHHFDTLDAIRFLRPKAFYVGACYGGNECQLSRFIKEQIWENGYVASGDYVSTATKQFEKYMEDMSKGDILLVKRLNGKGTSTMRIMAIGIVLGKNYDGTIRVHWVMTSLDLEVPLHTVGTISPGYSLSELPEILQTKVDKARAKFLRLNLRIENHYY